MPRHHFVRSALLALSVSGCGSSATEAVPGEDAVLTGEFTGRFTSEDQGILLDGFLTLDLVESDDGGLTGSFTLEGELDDGEFQQPIAGTGPLAGAVSADQMATLHFTATPDFCPDQSIEFGGFFDRRNAGLLVSGPILILDAGCAIALVFQSTISMQR
jgi:hypothetical protein